MELSNLLSKTEFTSDELAFLLNLKGDERRTFWEKAAEIKNTVVGSRV